MGRYFGLDVRISGVRDYADESFQFVQVSEGSVSVTAGTETRTLNTGESIVIERQGTMRAPSEDESLTALAWTEGRLVLRNVTLAGAASSLYRWYGIDASVPDSATAARALAGLGLLQETVVISLVADLFPPERRGRANIMIVVGEYGGSALGFALAGWLMPLAGMMWSGDPGDGGWRAVQIGFGMLGLLAAIPLFWLREPTRARTSAPKRRW